MDMMFPRYAEFFDDGLYRWTLTRGDLCKPFVLWVMLNPSSAGTDRDDPTIRRCCGFTRMLGYEAFVVVNLAALVATNPFDMVRQMRAGVDVVGGDLNRNCVEAWMLMADVIVFAWGGMGGHLHQEVANVIRVANSIGKPGRALGMLGPSCPRHPLRVGYDKGMEQLRLDRTW